jgi:phosphate transport system substrate-binding protein
MKTKKSYIAVSITTQVIIIPTVLTVSMFALSFVLRTFTNINLSNISSSATRLTLTIVAFLGSLIIGGFIGIIFSKRTKRVQPSVRVRYLTAIGPIIYALIFAVLAVVFSKGDYNSGWWGIYIIKNPVFLIFDVALYLSGLYLIVPIGELMAYTGFALGILLYEQVSKTTVKNQASKMVKVVTATFCTAVIIFAGIGTRDVANNGIVELLYGQSTIGNDLNEYDLLNIGPFKENNGLAKLDKPASLQFAVVDEMPKLDGATAAYPVYAAFVEAVYKGLGDYYKANKNNQEKDIETAFVASQTYPLNIVKCSKTSEAYENLINGQTDIIFVAEPSKAHIETIKVKGDEFVLTPIGAEAFVFFTNVNNPVDNLTIKQIQYIYSGGITNWKEVGGQNKSILPYQRPENSGSQTVMQNKVMKDVDMMPATTETFATGMGDIISQVANYKNAKNAIGYSFMYYSSSMIKNNQIKYMAVDGIKPTPDSVCNNTYPFTVPVYAVTLKSNSNKNVSRFIEWILSQEGQSLIEKTGYVPVE